MPIDAAGIQSKVNAGFAKAATVAGFACDLYRPSDPLRPLQLLDRVASIKAVFDARPNLKFVLPPDHGDFLRYAIVDGAQVEQGDYIVGPDVGTLFVASKSAFYAPTCVLCNAALTMRRGNAAAGFGAIGDGSDVAAGEQVLWQGWPVSMLYGGRGGGDPVTTPGDLPVPEFMIHAPAIPGVPDPQPGDILVDNRGRRLSVAWWEHGALGWRIVARLMTAG